jgi:hypothetical protein
MPVQTDAADAGAVVDASAADAPSADTPAEQGATAPSALRTLVQILLPCVDRDGRRVPASVYAPLRAKLVQRYGGLTAHLRAPAVGLWQPDSRNDPADAAGGPPEPVVRDDIVVLEVMVDRFERDWWRALQASLAEQLDQQSIVVRAWRFEQL